MLCSCVLVTKCYSVVQPISAKYALCTVYCAKCALCKRCSGTAQYVHCARSALCKRCTVPYVQEVHCAQFNVCTCVRCNFWHRDGMPVHFPETNLDKEDDHFHYKIITLMNKIGKSAIMITWQDGAIPPSRPAQQKIHCRPLFLPFDVLGTCWPLPCGYLPCTLRIAWVVFPRKELAPVGAVQVLVMWSYRWPGPMLGVEFATDIQEVLWICQVMVHRLALA